LLSPEAMTRPRISTSSLRAEANRGAPGAATIALTFAGARVGRSQRRQRNGQGRSPWRRAGNRGVRCVVVQRLAARSRPSGSGHAAGGQAVKTPGGRCSERARGPGGSWEPRSALATSSLLASWESVAETVDRSRPGVVVTSLAVSGRSGDSAASTGARVRPDGLREDPAVSHAVAVVRARGRVGAGVPDLAVGASPLGGRAWRRAGRATRARRV